MAPAYLGGSDPLNQLVNMYVLCGISTKVVKRKAFTLVMRLGVVGTDALGVGFLPSRSEPVAASCMQQGGTNGTSIDANHLIIA